jgi:hypothetical protein
MQQRAHIQVAGMIPVLKGQSPKDYQEELNAVEERIRTILGSGKYAIYRDSQETFPARWEVQKFQASLQSTPFPLDEPQQEALVDLFHHHDIPAGIGFNIVPLFDFQAYFFLGTQILPPPNDQFAGRTVLSGFPVGTTGSTAGSSVEFGEPPHAHVIDLGYNPPFSDSVWWSWTAPSTGSVTVDSSGSDYDAILAVYTGSDVSTLTEVARDDGWFGNRFVEFPAQAGITYHTDVST